MINSSAGLSKADKASLYFVAWMWSFSLWPYLLSVVRRIPILQLFTQYTIPVIGISLALFAIANNRDKLKIKDVLFYLICLLVYVIHMVVFPNNTERLIDLMPFVFFTILPYFFVGLFVDFNKQKRVLEYVSMTVILMNIIYRYVFRMSVGDDFLDTTHGDDMATAYFYLPHLLLLLGSILKKFNVWKLICVVFAFIMICGTGNRGALLMIVLFLLMYFFLIKDYKRPILSRVVIVIVGLFGITLLPYFAQFMSEYLLSLNLGLSDRAFQFYLEGDFAFDNGRNKIKEILYSRLSESPFIGYGLLGDRVITGMWAHDILLEFWVSFGYLFGSMLFVGIVGIIIQGYVKCYSENEKVGLLVLFVIGFAQLFVSSTFLQNRYFWLLLGYAICLRRNNVLMENSLLLS